MLVNNSFNVVKEVNLGFCKIVITKDDIIFSDNGVLYFLSDEMGWWDKDGTIYIWGFAENQLEIATHEVVEFLLMQKLKLPRWVGHNVALMMEKFVKVVWQGVKYVKNLMRRCGKKWKAYR